jgi:hypothetical protein
MIILDKNGQFTDTFNEYDSEVLVPAIKRLVADAVQWLDEHGAEPIDYRILEQVICDEVVLNTQSAWMTRIERIEAQADGDEKDD